MTDTPLQVETVAQLAKRWSISERQIHNLIGQGLPSRKIGRSRRFITSEVDAWLIGQEQVA